MSKRGKTYLEARSQVDREREHTPAEAMQLIKALPGPNFNETVEVHVRTGLNVRHADEQLRGTVALPNGLGKEVTIAVFAQGDKAREAEEAGADIVGAEDLVEKIQGGAMDFDTTIATPDLMGQVGRLGKVLGPRGLMPNPKLGTVTFDVAKAVREAKAGKVEFRVDKAGNIHAPIGKRSFPAESLVANALALIEAIMRAKPGAAKGTYLRGLTVSTTMGPGVHLDTQHIANLFKKAKD